MKIFAVPNKVSAIICILNFHLPKGISSAIRRYLCAMSNTTIKFTNAVHARFLFDRKPNTSTCKKCSRSFKGKHATNLLKHFLAKHEDEYDEILKENNSEKGNRLDNKKHHQAPVSKYFSVEKHLIQINMSPTTLKAAVVEMLTKNGRPLTFVEDSGFRKIIDPILAGFAVPITINRFNIRTLIVDAAQNLRKQISMKLQNRLISIKMDAASKLNRSILGVNVQILEDSTVSIITLAMAEIKTSSTSESFAGNFESCFEEIQHKHGPNLHYDNRQWSKYDKMFTPRIRASK